MQDTASERFIQSQIERSRELAAIRDAKAWRDRHARRFIDVYELAGKSDKLSDLELPVSSLYLLAAPSTPETARDDVLDLVANGEKLTHARVKEMIDEGQEYSRPGGCARTLRAPGAEHRRRAARL